MESSPVILHIETSGSYCSVALSRGDVLLGAQTSSEQLTHNASLAPYTRDLLDSCKIQASELNSVAVSAGPGSYTGLRVGVSFAKALCFSLDIPLIAISTLESLAMEGLRLSDTEEDHVYYPNIDARRMEVYTAAYNASGERIAEDHARIIESGSFDSDIEAGKHIVFCGTGAEKCRKLLVHDRITVLPLECTAEMLVMPALRDFRSR